MAHLSLTKLVSTFHLPGHPSLLTARASYAGNSNPRARSEEGYSEDGTISVTQPEIERSLSSPEDRSSTTYSTERSELSEFPEEFVKVSIDADPKVWEARNEHRYRASLIHRYHSSRK